MDPPPIHVQIQPAHARRPHKDRGKGSFSKPSAPYGRKTNNYRIRALADGRLGQQRALRTIPVVDKPEAIIEPDHPADVRPPSPDPRPTPPKKTRAPRSNTWAVCLGLFSMPATNVCLSLSLRTALGSSCLTATYISMSFCVTTVLAT